MSDQATIMAQRLHNFVRDYANSGDSVILRAIRDALEQNKELHVLQVLFDKFITEKSYLLSTKNK